MHVIASAALTNSTEHMAQDAGFLDDRVKPQLPPSIGAWSEVHDDVLSRFDPPEGLEERRNRFDDFA